MPRYKNYAPDRNKKSLNVGLSTTPKKYEKGLENVGKSEKLMTGIAEWTAFYREYPYVFCEEALGIPLKPFQRVILYAFFKNNYSMFLASRGLSKTWLTALFCVIKCILYPGSKIVIASGVKSQAMKIVSEKIPELLNLSRTDLLKREIKGSVQTSLNIDKPNVVFHNGSWIKICPATNNARSARATCLVLDEYRMVKPEIFFNVLRRFLSTSRQPGYLNKPEYSKPEYQERNQEIMLSSAYYKYNWSFNRYHVYLKAMLEGKGYFVCALNYATAIKEGLQNKLQILDEMEEEDWDFTGWQMEMLTIFVGESNKAYFRYDEIAKCRLLEKPLIPMNDQQYIELKGDPKKLSFYRPKQKGEIRILSADLAFIAGKKNDTSVFMVVSLIPYGSGFIKQLDYIESFAGGVTADKQALRLKQLFYDPVIQGDILVLDVQSAGVGVYDFLLLPTEDDVRGRVYPSWVAQNDETKISRSVDPNALPVIYAMTTSGGNASATLNEMYISTRNAFQTKKLRLLTNELDSREMLIEEYDFLSKDAYEQAIMIAPYMQTSKMITELTQLESEIRGGYLRLSEVPGHRKDSAMSLMYNLAYCRIFEADYKKRNRKSDYSELFSGNQLSSRASVSPFGTRQNPFAGRSNPFRR